MYDINTCFQNYTAIFFSPLELDDAKKNVYTAYLRVWLTVLLKNVQKEKIHHDLKL